MQKEKIFQMNNAVFSHAPQPEVQLHQCGTTYPNKNYSISRPTASLSCIEYIVSGKGHVTIDEESFSPVAGDTYFLTQGSRHFYHSDKKDPWEKLWINVSGELVTTLSKMYGVDRIHHFQGLNTSDLLLKFQYYAAHPDAENYAEKCISLLTALFVRMSNHIYKPAAEPPSPVRRMLDYIDRHETDTIRIEQLAQACEKSPSQVERIFRAELGMPPYRYILNRKLEIAKQLLRETGMSVHDIAGYLSFEDEFYFSGLFRRKVGVAPSKYRRSPNDK